MSYLANAIFVAQVDGAASPQAPAALETNSEHLSVQKRALMHGNELSLEHIRSPRLEISLLRLATFVCRVAAQQPL